MYFIFFGATRNAPHFALRRRGAGIFASRSYKHSTALRLFLRQAPGRFVIVALRQLNRSTVSLPKTEGVKGEPLMDYQVVTKTVSAQPLAAVRRRAFSQDIGRIWKPALDLVWEFLRRHEG